MFKPDPKKQVVLKFRELFGEEYLVDVIGKRISSDDCRRIGLRCSTRDGMYLTSAIVNGNQIATASDRDWRKAYKLLKLELEKLFSEGKPVQILAAK